MQRSLAHHSLAPIAALQGSRVRRDEGGGRVLHWRIGQKWRMGRGMGMGWDGMVVDFLPPLLGSLSPHALDHAHARSPPLSHGSSRESALAMRGDGRMSATAPALSRGWPAPGVRSVGFLWCGSRRERSRQTALTASPLCPKRATLGPSHSNLPTPSCSDLARESPPPPWDIALSKMEPRCSSPSPPRCRRRCGGKGAYGGSCASRWRTAAASLLAELCLRECDGPGGERGCGVLSCDTATPIGVVFCPEHTAAETVDAAARG